jgi:hypothetical protein
MQTQKRPLSTLVPVPKRAAATGQSKLQSAPVTLDAKTLRQVVGGTSTDGPHKGW